MAKTSGKQGDGPWLLLQLQLPSGRSTARVGVWRRLRRLGAVSLGATWSLPDDAENRESFEWLRRDIEAAGGEAILFEARPVDAAARAALERRRRGEEAPAPGADPSALAPLDRSAFRRRTWVTRPRPGVDRMASAWLVRKFVDPAARFAFADDPVAGGGRSVPFDTYGAELGHQQGLCTFEVLARRFGIDDAAVHRIGRVVRSVDLHEVAAEDGEAVMVERLVAGLRASHTDDQALLDAGMALFAALYAAGPGEADGRRAAPLRESRQSRRRKARPAPRGTAKR